MFEIALIYYLIIALLILGLVGMFYAKNHKLQVKASGLMVILALCVGVISFTSLPSNFTAQRIISIVIGLIPLLAGLLAYFKKINFTVFKVIVALFTIIVSVYFIVF